jgi:hypothetical protein
VLRTQQLEARQVLPAQTTVSVSIGSLDYPLPRVPEHKGST